MNKEADNIGKIFKDTLQNHRMESNADLWARLDTQLASQPQIVTPKASVLKSLSLAKVAASASLIVSVALAYNYIYLPLTTKDIKPVSENNQLQQNIIAVDSVTADTNIQLSEKTLQLNEFTRKDNIKETADNTVADNNFPTNNNFNTQNNTSFVSNNLNNQQAEPVKENLAVVYPVVDSSKNNKTIAENNQSYQQEVKQQEVITKAAEEIDLQIPNIFTPNGDGINDYFYIRNLDKYSSNQLLVSNRMGKSVCERINYQNDWNATNIPDGVYYYVLKIKSGGKEFVKSGVITIAR